MHHKTNYIVEALLGYASTEAWQRLLLSGIIGALISVIGISLFFI